MRDFLFRNKKPLMVLAGLVDAICVVLLIICYTKG